MSKPSSLKPKGRLIIPVEVQCEYARIPQGEFYTDLEKAIQVCQVYPAQFEAATGYRPPSECALPVTAYEGVAALGGRLHFPRDHQPMIANQGHVLGSAEQVDRLAVPDPWANPRFLRHVEWYRALRERCPGQVGGMPAGQEGPLTTAGLLRGHDFFADCLVDPSRAHRLLETCTETYIRWTKVADRVSGRERKTVGVADDYAGLLGPRLWPELVLPYYRRIVDALGPEGWALHSELLRREHLHHLCGLGLLEINLAENQYLQPKDVFEELPGVPFAWHILTVSEMRQGTPDTILQRVGKLASEGVREVRCEVTVNTPPQNVRAFLAATMAIGEL